VLISEPVVLDVLLRSLLLQGFCLVSRLSLVKRGGLAKITIGALGFTQLGLQCLDPLPELVALSGISTSSSTLGLQSSVLLLDSDEIENNVEDSREDKGEEKGSSGQVHYESATDGRLSEGGDDMGLQSRRTDDIQFR
jgi:hypothetical protein